MITYISVSDLLRRRSVLENSGKFSQVSCDRRRRGHTTTEWGGASSGPRASVRPSRAPAARLKLYALSTQLLARRRLRHFVSQHI